MSKSGYLLSSEDTLICFESINQMLDEDPKYMKEFCEAGMKSFTKFRNEFEESMRNRDLENLRKTGHRIKPVAQMIGVQQVNEHYINAKTLLKDEQSDEAIEACIKTVTALCDQITEEFQRQSEKL